MASQLSPRLTRLVWQLGAPCISSQVFGVTKDPFIVYTSNIFAILGLRSLYFVLAGMLDKLRLLHYGLAVILAFVALKMLLVHWIEVPVTISLGVILTTLAIFAIASKLIPEKKHN